MHYHPLVTLLHNGNGEFNGMLLKKIKENIIYIILFRYYQFYFS